MSESIIRVNSLSKRYRIGETVRGYRTFREAIMEGFTAPLRNLGRLRRLTDFRNGDEADTIWALKDVSFEVKEGEVLGIIGKNGAGKSTLLKILTRITEPTSGSVEIYGRVSSLLEVGTGFHPELTGRENIFLNGAVLGMRKKEIERKFDEIVAFSEIEKFIDTPVKRYSSGMYVRLAFAVAAHLEPEILLVDEVLAVGDIAFQKKCLRKMEDVAKGGRTIVFISHNMGAVKSLCRTGLLLKDGTVKCAGPISLVTNEYLKELFPEPIQSVTFQDDPSLRIQFSKVELTDPRGSSAGEQTTVRFEYVVRQETDGILLCVEVRNHEDLCVFYSNDDSLRAHEKRRVGKHTVTLTIPSHLLAPGEYRIAFGFWEPGRQPEHFPEARLFFQREEPVSRLSSHGIHWPGLIYLPVTWEYVSNSLNRGRKEA